MFLVNFDLLAYVPLFFFAATLHFIAAEVRGCLLGCVFVYTCMCARVRAYFRRG